MKMAEYVVLRALAMNQPLRLVKPCAKKEGLNHCIHQEEKYSVPKENTQVRY